MIPLLCISKATPLHTTCTNQSSNWLLFRPWNSQSNFELVFLVGCFRLIGNGLCQLPSNQIHHYCMPIKSPHLPGRLCRNHHHPIVSCPANFNGMTNLAALRILQCTYQIQIVCRTFCSPNRLAPLTRRGFFGIISEQRWSQATKRIWNARDDAMASFSFLGGSSKETVPSKHDVRQAEKEREMEMNDGRTDGGSALELQRDRWHSPVPCRHSQLLHGQSTWHAVWLLFKECHNTNNKFPFVENQSLDWRDTWNEMHLQGLTWLQSCIWSGLHCDAITHRFVSPPPPPPLDHETEWVNWVYKLCSVLLLFPVYDSVGSENR